MDVIENLTQVDYLLFVLWFFAILFGVKETIEILSYFKKKFRIKTGTEEDKETLEDRIATLEKHDKWQYNEISKISQGIEDIKKRLTTNERETNQRIIVQYGTDIYNLHSKFMT